MLKQESKEIEILNQTLNDASGNRRLALLTCVLLGAGVGFIGEAAAAGFNLENIVPYTLKPLAKFITDYANPLTGIGGLAGAFYTLFAGQNDGKGIWLKMFFSTVIGALFIRAVIELFGISQLAQ